MKKLFGIIMLAMLAVCSTTLVSCGDDDDDIIYSLDKSSITLYVDETSTLIYSGGNCNWSTDNHLIAEVKDGVVTAKHVGTTTIHANDLSCIVTVKPRYTSYTEPYMNWGASKNDVKKAMSGYTLKQEETNSLAYYGTGNIAGYTYTFENGELTKSMFVATLINSINLSDFLIERYWVIDAEKGSNNEYTFYLASVDLKTYVVYYVTSSGCGVMYIDRNSVKSSNQTELKANLHNLK